MKIGPYFAEVFVKIKVIYYFSESRCTMDGRLQLIGYTAHQLQAQITSISAAHFWMSVIRASLWQATNLPSTNDPSSDHIGPAGQ